MLVLPLFPPPLVLFPTGYSSGAWGWQIELQPILGIQASDKNRSVKNPEDSAVKRAKL